MTTDTQYRLGLYANGFVLGFVLMGFEMLSSRYLNPWFGSGIFTWAALISVTLFALMLGYYLGGMLVDRMPRAWVLGAALVAAAASMALTPMLIDPVIQSVMVNIGDGGGGVIAASLVILLVPLTIIAFYSPFCVRLLLRSVATTGRQTGAVYAINTMGNILGTLVTSFVLIPSFGTRVITYAFAVIVLLSAFWLIRLSRLEDAS
ncbi:MAG: fused MFS/spermidine synthase [Pseudomonadota bacterium]